MSSSAWRSDLTRLVAEAAAADGQEVVRAALLAEVDALQAGPGAEVPPWCPPVPVLATTACESGRLGVLLHTDGRATVHQARSQDSLLEQVHTVVEDGFFLAEQDADAAVATADREQLRRSGIVAPGWFSGSGFSEDDLLRACTVLLSAAP